MRQSLIAMMVYSLLFGAVAIVSLLGYIRGVMVFDIGLSARQVDLFVLVLSLAGLCKSLWHIVRIRV